MTQDERDFFDEHLDRLEEVPSYYPYFIAINSLVHLAAGQTAQAVQISEQALRIAEGLDTVFELEVIYWSRYLTLTFDSQPGSKAGPDAWNFLRRSRRFPPG